MKNQPKLQQRSESLGEVDADGKGAGKRGTDVREMCMIKEQGACADMGLLAMNTRMGWPRQKPKPSSKMRGTVSTEFRQQNILK